MTRKHDLPLKVFIHLAYGFGKNTWSQKLADGKIVGVNEDLAYGYERARRYNCDTQYSVDYGEKRFDCLFRYAVRFSLGFDLVHAFKNRTGIKSSDVVWTHTESQYLAVLLLMQFWRKRPKIIAQTVWLMDRWPKLPTWRRFLYTALIRQADVLTFHSPRNLATAQRLFPHKHLALVKFGIRNDDLKRRSPRTPEEMKILSVGNDRDRDWSSLLAATSNWRRCSLRIASATCKARLAVDDTCAVVAPPSSNKELFDLYDWADVVVVPLKQNDHASGLTAIQEAIVRGVPVIATKVGGLETYFSDEEVYFIDDNRPDTIRSALNRLLSDPRLQSAMTMQAQKLMRHSLNSELYVRAHVDLSREVLLRGPANRANEVFGPEMR